MKNYFEILEVDVYASDEIINRAFKLLAKRYHPDTQEDDKKQWAEEQFKLLNEAYEVLSDKSKREEYTNKLEFDKNDTLNSLLIKNADLEIQVEDLQRQLADLKNFYSSNHSDSSSYSSSNSTTSNHYDKVNNSYEKNFSQNMYNNQNFYNNSNTPNHTNTYQTYTKEPVYYESYYHPIKNKLKNLLAFFITLGVIIFIAIVIWNIPYTRNILEKIYQENSVIRMIINFFCE